MATPQNRTTNHSLETLHVTEAMELSFAMPEALERSACQRFLLGLDSAFES